jgi:hypothetical protein
MIWGRIGRACILGVLTLAAAGCGPTPRDENSARAKAVLERAGGTLFTDASTDTHAAVRHTLSGLECLVPRDGEFGMEIFPPEASNPGLYCSYAVDGVATTYVAVFYGATVSIDTAFGQALAASAGQASPVVWTGEPSAADKASPEGLPHFRIARFSANVNGEPSFLRVAMAERGGWFLQQITSGPIARAEAIEAASGEDWRRALRAFATAPQAS